MDSQTQPAPKLMFISAADFPERQPCCHLAHEQGYRRGYRDGYTYGIWDMGKRVSEAVWQRFEHFRQDHLSPWVNNAYHMDATAVRKDWAEPWRPDVRRTRSTGKRSCPKWKYSVD